MKPIPIIAAFLVACAVQAAPVALRWNVETSRVAPVAFDAVRGETLALEAAFKSYGTPVQMPAGGCALLYQTNGMGSAWWTAPATVASNRVTATITPGMVPAANTIVGYIGATGENYRAAFTLRFRHGPGASPNVIDAPVPILDLAHTVVINPPWPTTNDFQAATNVMQATLKSYVDEQIVGAGVVSPQTVTNITTNVVTKAYVESLGIAACDTNAVQGIINANVASNYLCTVAALNSETARAMEEESSKLSKLGETVTLFRPMIFNGDYDRYVYATCFGFDHCDIYPGNNGIVAHSGWGQYMADTTGVIMQTLPEYLDSLAWRTTGNRTLANYGITDGYSAANGNALATQVAAIGAHLNAEDARFVSTNYDSVVRMPEAYVEIKISNTWLTVWREMTRWNWFLPQYQAFSNATTTALAQKADRAWGAYDSETGGYSPDGYTQISSSNILIAAGMAYQRTVVTGGAVWVLQCHNGTAQLGGDTNGFFRVLDGEGNVQFEVIQGNRQELGCDASGISVVAGSNPTSVVIPYSVQADEHPTLQICEDLATLNWKSETDADCIATVSWTGLSGNYVATVTRKTAGSKMFVKASYLAGAETYINNRAPVGMSSIILNGTKYYLGTATVSGHTVLTLSTTPPNP